MKLYEVFGAVNAWFYNWMDILETASKTFDRSIFLSTRQFQKHVALIQDKLIMPVCKNFEKHLDFNCEKIKRGEVNSVVFVYRAVSKIDVDLSESCNTINWLK